MQCNAELARHTPGPWFLENGALASTGEFRIKIVSPWIEGSWTDDSEAAANMRLLAAAPDMLEALRGLLELEYIGETGDERITAARVAIAMATGKVPSLK